MYIRKFPFEVQDTKIILQERMNEIVSCKSSMVKDQKYYSWKLLEQAMTECYGLDMSESGMRKDCSKWCSDKCEFSISHSGNVVAIALSESSVGLDIEKHDLERFAKIRNRMLHTNEQEVSDDNLCKLWTIKEAIFKKSNKKFFDPAKIDTTNQKSISKIIVMDDKEFWLSVVSDEKDIDFVVLDGIELI